MSAVGRALAPGRPSADVGGSISVGALLQHPRQSTQRQLGSSRRCPHVRSEADHSLRLTLRKSGYNLAKMPFEIVLAPEAVEDLMRLTANARATVRTALETHLRHQPKKASRSRIRRLRGLLRPQYRLRVDEVRVFYDVSGTTVEVLAIVPKSEAESWLAQFGDLE